MEGKTEWILDAPSPCFIYSLSLSFYSSEIKVKCKGKNIKGRGRKYNPK
jgi:hypothetical protein